MYIYIYIQYRTIEYTNVGYCSNTIAHFTVPLYQIKFWFKITPIVINPIHVVTENSTLV